MWNPNKNKHDQFDGRCCVAPLMASKTVDRHPSPQLQMSNGVFRQDAESQSGRNPRGGRSDSLDSTVSAGALKPHTGAAGDRRWEAINGQDHPVGLAHLRVVKRLGYGDIGSVYLVELRGSGGAHFAMKVMDKASLVSRNKVLRADTERDILRLLDHPFLPTLYTHFETDKFYCLLMEFCSGGNLHSLRQKQPNKYFSEDAARFYALEVLLALEYLHMLGIVYRDLKPENVLIRDNGHIMLSDFDLSLRCSVSPTLVPSSSAAAGSISGDGQDNNCIQPSSFLPKITSSKKSRAKSHKSDSAASLPELMAEPTDVRSMSFVGTHEYLAPEIIRGEGHGSAVDWWTFGVFLYELLHGTTPFKGQGNRATLFNVVGQPLTFPDAPQTSPAARDLIRGLLVKEPHRRIAYKRGATEVKQHPFFEGVNWALVRSACPPHVPDLFDFSKYAARDSAGNSDKKAVEMASESGENHNNNHTNHHEIKKSNCNSNDNDDNSKNNENLDDESCYVDFEYF